MSDFFAWMLLLLLLLISTPLLGRYMEAIFRDSPRKTIPILSSIENLIYRFCQLNPKEEMNWKEYAKSLLLFNFIGFVFLFFLQLTQRWLPLNPQNFQGVEVSLAFNTAVSFVTNTDWQAYGGENTMSYLSQMLGLTVQNFLSAACGNAVLLALIRGLSRKATETVGNFWVDVTRTVIYLLLPLCLIFSILLVSQGVMQNFSDYIPIKTLPGETQVLPMGPIASQTAIKQLGTNGGGFFNANSAHPFENPTPLSNFMETFALLCLPIATIYMYGLLIHSRRQAGVICAVMLLFWVIGLGVAAISESTFNPILGVNPVLEGKETRIGSVNSVLWTISTTATSNGSVNAALSSLSPLAGGIALFNIMIGEVVFGGIGVGLCSMLMFVLLTVFLAGLMVGRTPEYLGKKIGKNEMQWVMLAILTPCALILLGAGMAIAVPAALTQIGSPGPHGLSEILYAFSSAAGNNGSAFAALNANTYFYNISLGCVMLLSRLSILLSSLAVAGHLGSKNTVTPSLGTFNTGSSLFCILLFSVIFILAALTFFPALSLGPIIEQLLMLKNHPF